MSWQRFIVWVQNWRIGQEPVKRMAREEALALLQICDKSNLSDINAAAVKQRLILASLIPTAKSAEEKRRITNGLKRIEAARRTLAEPEEDAAASFSGIQIPERANWRGRGMIILGTAAIGFLAGAYSSPRKHEQPAKSVVASNSINTAQLTNQKSQPRTFLLLAKEQDGFHFVRESNRPIALRDSPDMGNYRVLSIDANGQLDVLPQQHIASVQNKGIENEVHQRPNVPPQSRDTTTSSGLEKALSTPRVSKVAAMTQDSISSGALRVSSESTRTLLLDSGTSHSLRPASLVKPARGTSDLVAIKGVDPTIQLDIRYATNNNFMRRAVYPFAAAFLQKPAAEALKRVNDKLHKQGLTLLIFDAYRPQGVSQQFWDNSPPAYHGKYVANPKTGSRHNRGCAVDLSLYDVATSAAITMQTDFDDFTPRAGWANDDVTTAVQRYRNLLKSTMLQEGFQPNPSEWWHFDYKDWSKYPVLDVSFKDLQ